MNNWCADVETIASIIHLCANGENKIGSRFTSVTKEQILSINEVAVPKNTKMETKFGLTVFNAKLFNLSKLKF